MPSPPNVECTVCGWRGARYAHALTNAEHERRITARSCPRCDAAVQVIRHPSPASGGRDEGKEVSRNADVQALGTTDHGRGHAGTGIQPAVGRRGPGRLALGRLTATQAQDVARVSGTETEPAGGGPRPDATDPLTDAEARRLHQ